MICVIYEPVHTFQGPKGITVMLHITPLRHRVSEPGMRLVASRPQQFPPLTPTVLGLQVCIPSFSVDAGDLNSCLHTCMASTLTH